ncbi:MAG: PASTA domain-containing protein [Rhodothermales bacterium]|nr:PASTA domain-containing protein [Rhodothermales bacterium]MBO6779126.1 PASTA domain-containing protein [Rhodothermales bacterium]
MSDNRTAIYKERLKAGWLGFRQFLRNRYFWGGLAVIVVVAAAIYLAFDRALMPSVTRHGVSVPVPDVLRLPPEQADSILTASGLEMHQQILRKMNLPRNQVIDQRPPSGSLVKPGRSIYVTVNTGDTTTVLVPGVVGRSRRDVDGLLREQGLRAGPHRVDSIRSTFPADVISRQFPRPRVRVPRGSVVQLWYSAGPSAQFVVVPDVAGLPAPEAIERLSDVGLRTVILGPQDGVVRDQGPTAGTTVREGSEVRLRTRDPDPEG